MGFLHIGIYNGGYVNVCEYVHTPWKNNVCTILLVFDMLTTIFIGIYFHYVSKYWLWFSLIGLVFNIVSLFGIYLIPESPEYLYSFYRFPECSDIINSIKKWNKDHNLLPADFKFDVESDLKNIKFSRQIAEREETFIHSIVKGKEYRTSI